MVVVGGGAGGLPAALFSRWLGNDVILLEKAEILGGTANKAAFWYWVPNNVHMDADPEDDFLRYCARLRAPEHYDPDSPTLGLTTGSTRHQGHLRLRLARGRAAGRARRAPLPPLRGRPGLLVRAARGQGADRPRASCPRDARATMSDGGQNGIRTMSAAATRDGVDVRTSHRVQRLLISDGAVVGVDATGPHGKVRVRARKAVIFASGGFTHDVELRRNHLSAPVFGGCAALTNEGDFVRIGTPLGAQLRNMNYAWMCPVPLEKAVERDPTLSGMFSVAGDSMLFVDKRGRRVVNEKLPYNELAQTFFEWDATAGEYPNLVLIQVWDQRSQEHSASDEYGRLITGATDGARAARRDLRGAARRPSASGCEQYAHVTGGLTLADDWAAQLQASVTPLQRAGRDRRRRRLRPRRARRPAALQRRRARGAGALEPDLWPLADSGPYYAALVTGGTLDTKGGPKTDARGARARRPRPADRRAVRRRQLRGERLAARLLGRRGDDRPDDRLRLPGGAGRRRTSRSRAPRSRAPCHREENPRWL